jgi:hypothetical protein
MFGRRPDATRVTDLNTMRRFMPFISRRRNDSLFLMRQDIDAEAALEFLEKVNRERPPDRPITLFHMLLRSCANVIFRRSGVNRFVKGYTLWQRDGTWITFSAMREIKDGSPMLTIKRQFSKEESFEEMVDAIYDQLNAGRKGKKTTSDKEMNLALILPGFVIAVIMWVMRIADRFGMLPKSMIDSDPLFSTLFLANLGSINYPSGFHHLWEYGTISMFGVMGRIETGSDGRRKFQMAYTYDERIEDGLYSYITLEQMKAAIENPDLLDLSPDEPLEV